MSRSGRFLGGLGWNYFYQAAVLLAGLWLTPFLIRNIGQHDYGLWVLGAQSIYYLGLMDLGIVALLPREVAFATGRSIANSTPPDIGRILGESARVVLMQTPVVGLAAIALWLSTTAAWPGLKGPLAMIMAVYVLLFPARILTATLDGLQDLSYLGFVQIATWASNMAVMVLLVTLGWGLGALAAGWIVLQTVPAVCALVRLRRKFPEALPHSLPRMSLWAIFQYFRRSVWLSVAQLAQSFLSNSDVMILGLVMGPELVVVYACSGKLVSALANQPQLLMNVASPAISELRATGDRSRLLTVAICLTRLMMSASGLVACLVLTVNARFVAWWLPKVQFGGMALTTLLVAAMLLRHLNLTTTATLICFSKEKRISMTTLADGVVTILSCLIGIHYWGLTGAAVGSLSGVLLVSLPLNFIGLAQETGVSPWLILRSLLPWLWRFALAAAVGQLLRTSGLMVTVPAFFASCAFIALIYVLLVLPLFFQEPLAQYTKPLIVRLHAKLA
jgi:O-antigen/teichoic acid export membrane protein